MNSRELTDRLTLSEKSLINNFAKGKNSPPKASLVIEIAERLENLLFPSFFPISGENRYSMANLADELFAIICGAIISVCGWELDLAEEISEQILESLPEVKENLISDALAIYKGDPAASSVSEIILCYPGFFAVMSYRLARLFYLRGIPYLPRMMTERAHRLTGIDIHPGAKIGTGFCIDHGTGVVIGETATIGDRVKIYQGVTIGAKSFEPDGMGGLIKGKKRHPDIGDDCIIYAGATILGGDTVIGNGSVIGGNVWLTHSISPGSRVYYNEK